MPKYVTIGYGDQAGYDQTPEELRSAAHAQDKKLQDERALVGIAGVPVQVRNTCGVEVKTETGAFMSSLLPISGFAIIEAEDISQAVKMVAQSSCAIAYGVVEVWPLVSRCTEMPESALSARNTALNSRNRQAVCTQIPDRRR